MTERKRERYKKEYRPAYVALMKVYPFALKDLDGEQWADIPNYEGQYQVSTFGRVKSFKRGGVKILRPALSRRGYLIAQLWRNAEPRSLAISRLVALCFIPNPDNKPQVDHINGMKFNNHVSNLRWVTGIENINYAVELGLIKTGVECSCAKLTEEQVKYIRENPDRLSSLKLAKKFSIAHDAISEIQTGKRYKSVSGQIRKADYTHRRSLTDEQALWILSNYIPRDSEFGVCALAKKFGVADAIISRIVNGKMYNHLRK